MTSLIASRPLLKSMVPALPFDLPVSNTCQAPLLSKGAHTPNVGGQLLKLNNTFESYKS